jgi:polysaccharide deacetylase 2 family uncharacterized protein YibQ
MLNNQSGIIRHVYILILILLGVLFWLFWQGEMKDLTKSSIEFDQETVSILVKNGISDINIASQFRKEKSSGISRWIEYNRQINLPDKLSAETIAKKIEELALKNSYEFYFQRKDDETAVIEVKIGKKTISKLILAPPSGKASYSKSAKKVAIVIDDVGYIKDISHFTDLNIPVTFAILPRESYSEKIALKLKESKVPFLMHLPLEPLKYPEVDPGAYALLLKMDNSEIEKTFKENLESVPGIAGINNHMGSAFSADKEKMEFLLSLVKKAGVFYLDSYTTPESRAEEAAKKIKLPFLKNEFFLDIEDDPGYIRERLELLLKKAKKQGECITIGHIQKKHLAPALKEYIPKFRKEGIKFVYLTELLNKK